MNVVEPRAIVLHTGMRAKYKKAGTGNTQKILVSGSDFCDFFSYNWVFILQMSTSKDWDAPAGLAQDDTFTWIKILGRGAFGVAHLYRHSEDDSLVSGVCSHRMLGCTSHHTLVLCAGSRCARMGVSFTHGCYSG